MDTKGNAKKKTIFSLRTDEELVQEIQITTNASGAWAELSNRYYLKVLERCKSILKSKDAAEDMTQEIMLFILLKISSYHFKSKFSTWLLTVVNNKCIDVLRRKNKSSDYLMISDELAEELEDLPETNNEVLLDQLEITLTQLSKDEAWLISERFIDKKSFKEIAFELDISPAAVKMKMGRLIKKTRKLMTQVPKEIAHNKSN